MSITVIFDRILGVLRENDLGTITALNYQGTWNANTNNPVLADGVGAAGDFYVVNVAGTQNLGSGAITFAIGDIVIYNGFVWQKLNNNFIGVHLFTELFDVPNSYVGQAFKELRVNAGETALEFVASAGGTYPSSVNTVYVDSVAAPIATVVYNDVASALVYVNTQVPAATNLWKIIVLSEVDNSIFQLPSYVTVFCYNYCRFTNTVGFFDIPGGVNLANPEILATFCRANFDDFTIAAGQVVAGQFKECSINQTASVGLFSDPTAFAALFIYNSNFGLINLQGNGFVLNKGCIFDSDTLNQNWGTGIVVSFDTAFVATSGNVNTDGLMQFVNSVFDFPATTGTGMILINNCYENQIVTFGNSGGFTNIGAFFDNRNSGILGEDVQASMIDLGRRDLQYFSTRFD